MNIRLNSLKNYRHRVHKSYLSLLDKYFIEEAAIYVRKVEIEAARRALALIDSEIANGAINIAVADVD